MVKNFVPNCDFCGREITEGVYPKRNVPADGAELLMFVLENSDPNLEFIQNPDGTVALDTCMECYGRLALNPSGSVN